MSGSKWRAPGGGGNTSGEEGEVRAGEKEALLWKEEAAGTPLTSAARDRSQCMSNLVNNKGNRKEQTIYHTCSLGLLIFLGFGQESVEQLLVTPSPPRMRMGGDIKMGLRGLRWVRLPHRIWYKTVYTSLATTSLPTVRWRCKKRTGWCWWDRANVGPGWAGIVGRMTRNRKWGCERFSEILCWTFWHHTVKPGLWTYYISTTCTHCIICHSIYAAALLLQNPTLTSYDIIPALPLPRHLLWPIVRMRYVPDNILLVDEVVRGILKERGRNRFDGSTSNERREMRLTLLQL